MSDVYPTAPPQRMRRYRISVASIALLAVFWFALAVSSVGVQAEPEDAAVVAHTSYIEWLSYRAEDRTYQGDFLHVIGVIQVTGSRNLKHVRAEVTFRDSQGRQIEGAEVTSLLGIYRLIDGEQIPYNLLGPGDRLPFHVVLLDESASARVVTYNISVKYSVTDEDPYRGLVVVNERALSRAGLTVMTGELVNSGESGARAATVHAAFYDHDGKIACTSYFFVPMHVILPGERFAFLLYSHSPLTRPGEDLTCELVATCVESDQVPYREFTVVTHRLLPGEHDTLIVEGEVANIGDEDATSVVVAISFYDGEGRPLGGYYTNIDEIGAGQSKTFEVIFWESYLAPEVSNYTIHVSSAPYTGPEEPSGEEPELVRSTPSPSVAAVAVAVGASVSAGLTAVASVTGLGEQLNAAISSLPLPGPAKEFLKFYTEETFKHLTGEELEARRRRGFISGGKLLSLALSALVLFLVFSYVEVNGFPNFTDVNAVLSVAPYVLLTVVTFFVAKEMLAYGIAAVLDVWCDFRIWLYGLVALLISGFGFLLPFGSPGRTDYEGDLDVTSAGTVAALKVLCDLALMLPFWALLSLGYTVPGDAGLLMATMSAYYSSFPFRPLEGQAIFRYNRILWAGVFLAAFALFASASLKLLPSIAYMIGGGVAAVLLVSVLIFARRRKTATPGPPLPPPPPPPPAPMTSPH